MRKLSKLRLGLLVACLLLLTLLHVRWLVFARALLYTPIGWVLVWVGLICLWLTLFPRRPDG